MSYMRNKNERIPSEDYRQIRKLLSVLNSDIHNYNQNKKKRFNLRFLFNEAKIVFKSARAAEIKKIENNAKVEQFYKKYGYTLLGAFLSYTPFFRSKIVLFVIIGVLRALADKFTTDYLKKAKRDMEWLKREVDKPGFHSKLNLG